MVEMVKTILIMAIVLYIWLEIIDRNQGDKNGE